jgi:hypothetical protein
MKMVETIASCNLSCAIGLYLISSAFVLMTGVVRERFPDPMAELEVVASYETQNLVVR